MRKLTLAAIACVALTGAACTEAGGWYRPVAEAKCRDQGLSPATDAFRRCVKTLEDAEYEYQFRITKTAGD